MKQKILDEHHVSRHCKGTELDDGLPMATAFMLKPGKGEHSLSVNWLEYFGDDNFSCNVSKIRESIELTLKATARFAVFNVREAKEQVAKLEHGYAISFQHEPDGSNESHSLIHGLNSDSSKNFMIAEMLVECDIQTFPAKL